MQLLNLSKTVEILGVPIPKIFDAPSNGFLLRIGYIYWSFKTRRVIKNMDYSEIKLIHHTNYSSEVLPNPLPKRNFGSFKTIVGPLGSTQNLKLSRILVRDNLDFLILFMDTLKVFTSRLLFNLFVTKQTQVIVNSEVIANQIYPQKKKNLKIEDSSLVVYPSLILEETKPTQEYVLGSKTSPKFVIVGVFNRRKKIDFALEVLANLQFPEFHCDIYGEGPEEERLKKYAVELGLTEQISWKGTIDRETLRSLLPSYDAVLHPSVREAASTITGESIIAGVPILGFEGTGLAGTMSLHGLTRYLVSIPNGASKSTLVENFVQKLHESVGTRIEIGNPFSLELVQAEVSRWYELE
jgi:glycosyltransferase involved in cell wall biosynthesis